MLLAHNPLVKMYYIVGLEYN